MIHLDVDKGKGITIYKQLYTQLIDKILNSELKRNQKLPGSRTLSKDLGISRNVVLEVYEQLISEGYIVSRKGSGSYVSNNIKISRNTPRQELKKNVVHKANKPLFSFESGIPDLHEFPREKWGRSLKKCILEADTIKFHYGSISGEPELQKELANYLLRNKGISCNPDNIYIVSGTSQAVFILSKIVSSVILEDPSVNFIKSIFMNNHTAIEYIESDEEGVITDNLDSGSISDMIMVSPSHQFPLGGTLSIQRRLELVSYVEKYSKYIIEDDYDSEFRFKGSPVNSIYRLSPDRVIHIGTFSKILSPSLRLGYMLVPETLKSKVEKVKKDFNIFTPNLIQSAMAGFIKSGYLERHIHKMKRHYKRKQEYIIGLLNKSFADNIKIVGTSTGLHFTIDIINSSLTSELLKSKALESGLTLSLVNDYRYKNNRFNDRIIIGFGNLSNDGIKQGVYLLRRLFEF